MGAENVGDVLDILNVDVLGSATVPAKADELGRLPARLAGFDGGGGGNHAGGCQGEQGESGIEEHGDVAKQEASVKSV